MTATDRPWLSSYRKGTSTEIKPEFTNALDMFKAAVRRNPDLIAIKYFDGTVSVAELDAQSTALAAGLLANGFPDSMTFLDALSAEIAARVPDVTFARVEKASPPTPLTAEQRRMLTEDCVGVVAAYGH